MESTTLDIPVMETSKQIDAADLSDLMERINEVTSKLQETHNSLHAEVDQLKEELAQANVQLQRSRTLSALGEMAAGIAHEIRNPLGSILLYGQMLVDDLADRPEQARISTRICHAVERMDSIVGDVLSFARDTIIQRTDVNVADLLKQAITSCDGLIAANDVTIRLDISDQVELIKCDSSLLLQAMGNLIRNGIEAMKEADGSASTLTIGARLDRRRVIGGSKTDRIILYVQDSGTGIPEDVISRMFNPFFTTRQTGTGLGLAIVHRIVDAHGGEVAVTNPSEGGACVELCLPPESGNRQINSSKQTHTTEIEFVETSLTNAVRRRIAMERHK